MISFVMYFPELSSNSYKFPHVSVMMCLPFAVPAVLYCFNNNIALHMQLQMDPTTYQVLNLFGYKTSFFPFPTTLSYKTGSGCSKLTMLFIVKISLKLQTLISCIC